MYILMSLFSVFDIVTVVFVLGVLLFAPITVTRQWMRSVLDMDIRTGFLAIAYCVLYVGAVMECGHFILTHSDILGIEGTAMQGIFFAVCVFSALWPIMQFTFAIFLYRMMYIPDFSEYFVWAAFIGVVVSYVVFEIPGYVPYFLITGTVASMFFSFCSVASINPYTRW